MTDVRCPMCDYRVDLLNESQPVCPRCGTDPFEGSPDELDDWEIADDEELSSESVASFHPRTVEQCRALSEKYRRDRTGVSRVKVLQGVCLECHNLDVEQQGGRRRCRNPQCGATWYVNHCWQCGSSLDSRDTRTVQCEKCNWHRCPECGACDKNCRESPQSRDS
jgi:hypothetical protein